MNWTIFLAFVAAVGFCQAFTSSEDSEWEQFKATHGKSYSRISDEQNRKQIYFNNKKSIEEHNERYARNEVTYYVTVNKFTDMLPREVSQIMNGLRPSKLPLEHAGRDIFDVTRARLPKSFDWRRKHVVTKVKNQGSCGSCWAFSTTGSLEGHHAIKTKKLVSLSEQNLMDCSWPEGNESCGGGLMDEAFEYIKKNRGIDTEASYPYSGKNGTDCHFKRKHIGATLKSWVDIRYGSENALKEAVAKKGPVSVGIDASHKSFHSYAGGVYNEPACNSTNLDHGVLVIGYGKHRGTPYWLVKNSWGSDWGLKGYIMMSRNKNNQCGIVSQASYPVV